jgi:hypothetical protein
MPTPMQDQCYALALALVRLSVHALHAPDDLRNLLLHLGLDLGLALEQTVTASNRLEFEMGAHGLHAEIRRIKFMLRLLDDLELMDPEDASRIGDIAEHALRIVLASLRTAQRNRERTLDESER